MMVTVGRKKFLLGLILVAGLTVFLLWQQKEKKKRIAEGLERLEALYKYDALTAENPESRRRIGETLRAHGIDIEEE